MWNNAYDKSLPARSTDSFHDFPSWKYFPCKKLRVAEASPIKLLNTKSKEASVSRDYSFKGPENQHAILTTRKRDIDAVGRVFVENARLCRTRTHIDLHDVSILGTCKGREEPKKPSHGLHVKQVLLNLAICFKHRDFFFEIKNPDQ